MNLFFKRRLAEGARYDSRSQTLILGASGFIGKRLSEKLTAQSLDLKTTEFHVKNIVHLLGTPNPTLGSTAELVALDLEIGRLAIETNARVIYGSGNNVYPLGHVHLETPQQIDDLYALNKSLGESVFLNMGGFPAEVMRIGDVFGKGQRHGNFFRELEKAAAAGVPFNLYGNGRKTRSYIWIEDLTDLITDICHSEIPDASSKRIHNIAYEESASNFEIAMAWSRYFQLPINHILDSEENETVRVMKTGSLRIPSGRSLEDALNGYFETIQGDK